LAAVRVAWVGAAGAEADAEAAQGRPEPKRGGDAAAPPLAPSRASDSPPRGSQFGGGGGGAGVPGKGFRRRG